MWMEESYIVTEVVIRDVLLEFLLCTLVLICMPNLLTLLILNHLLHLVKEEL